MKRKIIQIAFCPSGGVDSSSTEEGHIYDISGGFDGSLFALCNDGTILKESREGGSWQIYSMGEVPQNE